MSAPVPPDHHPAVAAVVIAYGNADEVAGAIEALRRQTHPLATIVLVENHPLAETAARFSAAGDVDVVVPEANLGFGGGLRAAAAAAPDADLLFVVNPDALAAPDCLAQLAAVMADDPAVAIVGAQILMPDGTTSGGANPVHPTGLSWGGRHLEPAESGPPRPVLAISGAGFLVRASHFRVLGGFTDRYFLYCEDTDLCWRAWLAGLTVSFCPDAHVTHDYAFDNGPAKWRYLERNRLWMVATNFDALTLVLLAPLLACLEVAVWLMARRGGWQDQKQAAWREVFQSRSWLADRRREVQSTRRVPDHRLLLQFSPEIDTPVLASPLLSAAARPMRWYYAATVALLRAFGR